MINKVIEKNQLKGLIVYIVQKVQPRRDKDKSWLKNMR